MDSVIKLVSLGRAARNTCQIKVRQTLGALYVPEKYKHLIARMEDLIKEEINVKEIKYISDKDNFITYEFKANFKFMGPKYGKHVKRIVSVLENMDSNHIVESLHKNKEYYLEMDGSTFKLTEEDLVISIKDKKGFVFESYNKELFVALDTNLNEELIEEGLARELVAKIQNTRKNKEMEIMDRIKIFYVGNDKIQSVFIKYADYIKAETLSDYFHCCKGEQEDMIKWDINGNEVFMTVEKM
jgi:isoleucyl-tRNA synthetase